MLVSLAMALLGLELSLLTAFIGVTGLGGNGSQLVLARLLVTEIDTSVVVGTCILKLLGVIPGMTVLHCGVATKGTAAVILLCGITTEMAGVTLLCGVTTEGMAGVTLLCGVATEGMAGATLPCGVFIEGGKVV